MLGSTYTPLSARDKPLHSLKVDWEVIREGEQATKEKTIAKQDNQPYNSFSQSRGEACTVLEWKGHSQICQNTSTLPVKSLTGRLTMQGIEFIQSLLTAQPLNCPTAQIALQHPWLLPNNENDDYPPG
jgi:hypothetical protein